MSHERTLTPNLLDAAVADTTPLLKASLRSTQPFEVWGEIASQHTDYKTQIFTIAALHMHAKLKLGLSYLDEIKKIGQKHFPQVKENFSQETLALILLADLDSEGMNINWTPEDIFRRVSYLNQCLDIEKGNVREEGYRLEETTADRKNQLQGIESSAGRCRGLCSSS